MLHKLKLDHDGVYWGAEPIAEKEIKDGDVVLDHAPDNLPGRYKWNAAEKRLDALPASQVKAEPGAPTLEQAFYDLTEMVQAMDPMFAVPARVTAWREWFEKTLDEKGKG